MVTIFNRHVMIPVMYVPLGYLCYYIGLITDIPDGDILCQEIVDTIEIFRNIFDIVVLEAYFHLLSLSPKFVTHLQLFHILILLPR